MAQALESMPEVRPADPDEEVVITTGNLSGIDPIADLPEARSTSRTGLWTSPRRVPQCSL